MQQTTTEVPNIISTSGEKKERIDPPLGETMFGLVDIKLRSDCWVFDRETKKPKLNPDGTNVTEKKYALTFRSLEDSKAFFYVEFRPKWNEKSTMYQALRAATGKKLKLTSSPDEVYKAMMALKGKWFLLELKKGEKRPLLTTSDAITPHAGPELYPDCLKYFNEIDEALKYGDQGGH